MRTQQNVSQQELSLSILASYQIEFESADSNPRPSLAGALLTYLESE
jgi:hypothetical protein